MLGIVCVIGMLLYNKFFSQDTPEANHRARKIMLGIYILFAGAGLYFFVYILFIAPQIKWTTLAQSLIMLLIGGGGVRISLRRAK